MQIAAHALFSRPMGGERKKKIPKAREIGFFKNNQRGIDPMKSGEQRGGQNFSFIKHMCAVLTHICSTDGKEV